MECISGAVFCLFLKISTVIGERPTPPLWLRTDAINIMMDVGERSCRLHVEGAGAPIFAPYACAQIADRIARN